MSRARVYQSGHDTVSIAQHISNSRAGQQRRVRQIHPTKTEAHFQAAKARSNTLNRSTQHELDLVQNARHRNQRARFADDLPSSRVRHRRNTRAMLVHASIVR